MDTFFGNAAGSAALQQAKGGGSSGAAALQQAKGGGSSGAAALQQAKGGGSSEAAALRQATSRAPSGESSQKSSSGSGYDPEEQRQLFLKMLVTQMENQNPLDPMKNKEMLSQMAQFSGVEQQIKTNDLLGKLAGQQQSRNMDAVGLLGKTAWVEGQPARSTGEGQSHKFQFSLDSNGSRVAKVKNDAGKVVRTIDLGSLDSGMQQAEWDGKTDDGKPAPPGTYDIQVMRADVKEPKPQPVQIQSTVQEVRYGEDGTQVGIGDGRFVAFDKVAAVTNEKREE
ncbi:flagellar hook assembly protein FlgD [Thiohalorhabdus methylotrophus]|uniref:Basal-body rod modification protein FlgD n=1 Tax=Thiohalorhabdus methylotrophus TaxID=3242694 RepID=A0ABV4TY54_9GAMM